MITKGLQILGIIGLKNVGVIDVLSKPIFKVGGYYPLLPSLPS